MGKRKRYGVNTATLLLVVLTLVCSLQMPARAITAENKKSVHSHNANAEMKIALSFDDGPHCRYTAEILDILAEYGVKATFFVIGVNAQRYPELIRREIAEGHEIGNHTYCHPHLSKIGTAQLQGELEKSEKLLWELAEYRPRLFRPPEGLCTDAIIEAAKERDYSVILWTVDTRDWAHTPAATVTEHILSRVKSGDIILFHDFIDRDSPTAEALRVIIPTLLSKGYQFVTVSELLNEA